MPLASIEPLSTARLTLREVRFEDLADLMDVNRDPEVTRFLPYAIWQSDADARAWLQRMNALVEAGSARQLVIARRVDGRVIGSVLLFKYDEGSSRLEVGYALGSAHWRKGYASEALRVLLSHTFRVMRIRRVEAEVDVANEASNRLLRSLGFSHEGLLRERWVANGQAYGVNVYGLLASEWREGAA